MSDSNRIFKESLPNKETKRLRFQPSKKRMSDSNRIKESLPNKETKRLRFQPSKKWIRLTNLSNHHVLDGFNVQAVLSLVIVLVMCLAGTIQPAQTAASERRRLPNLWKTIPGVKDIAQLKKLDRPNTIQLAHLGYFYLGKFKTRNAGGFWSRNANKNRYYFYKKYTEMEKVVLKIPADTIGSLLLCTEKAWKVMLMWDKTQTYNVRRILQIKNNTCVKPVKVRRLKTNKWLYIESGGEEIELRLPSSRVSRELLSYFTILLETPHWYPVGKAAHFQMVGKA